MEQKYKSSRFKGKVAIVTGASEGIGYGIALRIAQEGGHVVITGRSEEKVKKSSPQFCHSRAFRKWNFREY